MATAEQVLVALPSGSAALMKVPGITMAIAEAAGVAYVNLYIVGIRTVALVSIAFGGTGIIACLFLEEITPKMIRRLRSSWRIMSTLRRTNFIDGNGSNHQAGGYLLIVLLIALFHEMQKSCPLCSPRTSRPE